MRRFPRGYRGLGHETIGSDILAVYRILKMPEQVLGADEAKKLATVDRERWYPIAWLLDLMEKLEASVGQYGLTSMGRTLFRLSHEKRVLEVARSARDILYGIDGMYHHSNRGTDIGGWTVIEFEPGVAALEKTTPHHCVMEQGILSAALTAVGCPSSVTQRQCLRDGADTCIYTITSVVTDKRWTG
jgi:hypothetical protein